MQISALESRGTAAATPYPLRRPLNLSGHSFKSSRLRRYGALPYMPIPGVARGAAAAWKRRSELRGIRADCGIARRLIELRQFADPPIEAPQVSAHRGKFPFESRNAVVVGRDRG